MKIKSFFFAGLVLIAATSAQSKPDLFSFNSEENIRITVNNRILAKVNDKPISVVDVMKKMDLIFYKEFPDYTSSKTARFQFYNVNWKSVLQELINKELVLADAEENKLNINSGEVRQEMEQLFGPNIITNLDKIGMSLDEALKIVKGDLTIRRMMLIRINSKAIRTIGPQDIRNAYEEYIKNNVKTDVWHYHVISIRDKDIAKGTKAADLLANIVKENPTLEVFKEKIKQLPGIEKSTAINVSDEYEHNELQLSPAYKEILLTLKAGAYSEPVSQRSRTDKTTVYRIFFLKEKVEGKVAAFNDIENEI